jgi:hypothetical protein
MLRKRRWPGGKERRQIKLLVKARVLPVIMVGTCHTEAGGKSWRRVVLLL